MVFNITGIINWFRSQIRIQNKLIKIIYGHRSLKTEFKEFKFLLYHLKVDKLKKLIYDDKHDT